jgi:type IV pilus assembly protein PilV
MKPHHSSKGFTLIEVLIALVILAIGLLGMATLMMTSLQSSQSAYLRSQASLLAYDITERMRANHAQAITTNDYTLAKNAGATSDPGCKAAGCSASQQAQQDLHDWRAYLSTSIPSATATISRANQNEYTINISWEESSALQRATDNPNFELRVNL